MKFLAVSLFLACASVVMGAAPCVDANANCATYAKNGFCTNAQYTPAQRQQSCAKTCKFCTAATTCGDTSTNCASWVANGFCKNAGYTADQKKAYCGKSCNLCGNVPPSKTTPTTTKSTTTVSTTTATTTTSTTTTSTTTTTTTTKKQPAPPPAACPDTNTNCATWARNGFCTNTHYTFAQRKSFCCKTCKMG